MPVQGQRSAVVIELGVLIDVDGDIAPAGSFIANVVIAPFGKRSVAAIAFVFATVNLQQRLKIVIHLSKKL